MPVFVLTKKALSDLIEIGRYTNKRWGTEQRNTYLTSLDDCFQQLAINPLKGKDCSEIRSGYRKMNIGSHIVFYRQRRSDEIEIVRILHCRMDFEAKLSSDQN